MSVKVVARIRPLLGKELDKDIIVRGESSADGASMNIVRIPNPKNEAEEFSFMFNGVYPMETTQETLFTNEVAPHLKSLFQGLDVTIFAYGVTGTGKTHTMRGGLKLSDRGVIPRLLSGIYRRGRKVTKDSGGETSVAVKLSYYEIYNDKVFDLFEPPEKRSLTGLPIREKDGKTIVVGLQERDCEDLKTFEKLYIEANNNRSTAGTKLNAQSSRSHAILMVRVIQTKGDEMKISTASAIDLAGSEDNRRTENGKERMVESASINKSLFVLSQCIDAIGRGDKRIPYRESKMTRILSLGQNNGITIMILNLAPVRSYHLDTLSSLNVSSRAKRIEVREIENEIVFKQPPRSTAPVGGMTMQRQPLRPLANAHNAKVNAIVTANKEKDKAGEKPAKAFSVYSDRSKVLTAKSSNTGSNMVRRTNSTGKRPLESSTVPRPAKIARPNGIRHPGEMSAAQIEQMVERKVTELLANRAMDQPAAPAPIDISEAVQRRLEALEKKVESGSQDDARTEGLRFLLMAKQHKERGEDSSALKMYELALPFFPDQAKLLKKIEALQSKIQAKREHAYSQDDESAAVYAPVVAASQRRQRLDDDDEYQASDGGHSVYASEDEEFTHHRTAIRARKPKAASKAVSRTLLEIPMLSTASSSLETFPSEAGMLSPRSSHLLSIINSRDVIQIRGLSGVGAKKARDLVEFLDLQSEDAGGRIETLDQLRAVPGMGSRTVEKAYEGLIVGF